MALPARFSLLHSVLNDFLFTTVGEKLNGMMLNVVSGLPTGQQRSSAYCTLSPATPAIPFCLASNARLVSDNSGPPTTIGITFSSASPNGGKPFFAPYQNRLSRGVAMVRDGSFGGRHERVHRRL